MNPSVETEDAQRGPAAPAQPVTAGEGGGGPVRAGDSDRKLLIVDDEASILSSLRRLLRREGYVLVVAGSGPEALSRMQEEPAQVIMSDFRMPEMTGTEFLREVQKRWPETVRIVLSGYSEVEAIISAINDGAIYKFISKPWNDEELKGNIRQAFERYDLSAENRRLARELAKQNERLREANERLNQRAADASAGLASVQDLLEIVGAGVVTMDESGLIVGSNQLACQLVSPEGAQLIGLDAGNVLPCALSEVLSVPPGAAPEEAGRIDCHDRSLEWRVRLIGTAEHWRGRVLTLWEKVP